MIIAAATITDTAFTSVGVAAAEDSNEEAAITTATGTVSAASGVIQAAIEFPQVKICIAP